MSTLREVRHRIGGIRKTQKITKAMKMVAAARLRRAQSAVVAARPYARALQRTLGHLSFAAAGASVDLMTLREVRTVAVVVITSDRGMCGSFNTNLVKGAVAHIETVYPGMNERRAVRLVCVGKKGLDFFSRRAYTILSRHAGVFSHLEYAAAQGIARELVEAYRKGEVDRVDVVYNEFKSVAQQRLVVEQFLPVPPEAMETGKRRADYLYEPSAADILAAMLPRHLNFQFWRILLESSASAEGARMVAMENATENANEMISTLQLQYNKARQAQITKELLEIVSGAEALSQAD
jgi:F-type H+-transporting ATPase subunit gamma